MAEIRGMVDKLGQILANGKLQKIDLLDFMQKCQILFEECGECLESGTAREKEELLKDLLSTQETLESDIESLSKETGRTQEQMLSYTENPDNFPEEAWQTMQKTWRRITAIKTRKKQSKLGGEEGDSSSWMKK